MPWVKLDDRFFDHPKITRVGRDARDLYIASLCYCARNLTDGFVPENQIRRIAADAEVDNWPALVEKLLAPMPDGNYGLWERAEGGYLVHDYLDYNPSKEKVLADREKRAMAGAIGGVRSGESKREAKRIANAIPESEAESNPVPIPVPIPVTETHAGDTPSGNGSRRPQPVRETPKQPNAVYAIFAGYCRGLGIEPKMIPKKQQAGYLSVAASLLEAEYTPAEVEQCTRALKGQNWWQDKPLHLRNVAEAIPQWKQNGLQPSREAKNVPASLRPPSDASKRVVRALTPDEFNRRYPGRSAGVSDVQGSGLASDAGPPSGPS